MWYCSCLGEVARSVSKHCLEECYLDLIEWSEYRLLVKNIENYTFELVYLLLKVNETWFDSAHSTTYLILPQKKRSRNKMELLNFIIYRSLSSTCLESKKIKLAVQLYVHNSQSSDSPYTQNF